MTSSSGSARAKACSVPPTMKVRVPASEPTTPPETGASMLECPASRTMSAALRADSTSIVEESMNSTSSPVAAGMISS